MASDAKVERVARALCKANDEDPDKLVSIPGRVRENKNFNGPQWQKHAQEARDYIAAFEALNG